jgi:hypothetical protein
MFKIKGNNKLNKDDFEEKLNTMKSKRISRPIFNEKRESNYDNQARRQKLLINPKLSDIMYIFDPELLKGNEKISKLLKYKNNKLNNQETTFRLNRYNSDIFETNTKFHETKSKSPEVKDKLKNLKLSFLSDRGDNNFESKPRYFSLNSTSMRSREISPKEITRIDSRSISPKEESKVPDKYSRFNRFYSSPLFNYKQRITEDWFYSPISRTYSK